MMIDEIGKIANQIKTTKLDRYDMHCEECNRQGQSTARQAKVTLETINVDSNIKALSET